MQGPTPCLFKLSWDQTCPDCLPYLEESPPRLSLGWFTSKPSVQILVRLNWPGLFIPTDLNQSGLLRGGPPGCRPNRFFCPHRRTAGPSTWPLCSQRTLAQQPSIQRMSAEPSAWLLSCKKDITRAVWRNSRFSGAPLLSSRGVPTEILALLPWAPFTHLGKGVSLFFLSTASGIPL